ncbi:hypothetical protein PFTANZ_06659, partial [Plasmodium falciparum Tanzania (2000708)]
DKENEKEKQNREGLIDPNELDNQLRKGVIPDDFKRQMFYTFADYRDLCLGKDIGKDVRDVENNINKVLPNNSAKSANGHSRQEWWKKYREDIWDGMLCGLSYASGNENNAETIKSKNNYKEVTFSGGPTGTKLTEFAERSQFLRWFTEWGEDFCKQQKKEYKELVAKCNNCDVDTDGKSCNAKCGECKTQCEKYKKWIETWIDNYKKQKERYTKVKGTLLYNEDKDVKNSDDARDYLDKQLQNMKCVNGITNKNCDYTCMNESSSTARGDSMPESLDDEPKDVKGKCNCKDEEAPPPQPARPDVCNTVATALEDNKYIQDACNQKYGKNAPSNWK